MTHALRPTTPDPEEEQLVQQLKQAEGRLVDHYVQRGEVNEERVRRTFNLVSERFVSAKVRAFLPVLIERAVRRELEG